MDKKNKPDRREILSDCLMVAGAVLLCVGIGLIDREAGIIAAGVISIIYGGLIARGGSE